MAQRYALVDANGMLVGFYSDDIIPESAMPAGVFPISDDLWQKWLQNANGLMYQNGVLEPYAPPPPPNPVVISASAYLGRFLPTETATIHAAALTNPPTPGSLMLFNYLLLVAASGVVDLADPAVIAGHEDLVALGLLTADRSASILTP